MPQPLPSREKFAEIFAGLFPDEAEALGVIIKVGGARETLRRFSNTTPMYWWGYIYDLAIKGRFDANGLEKILRVGAEIYPGNTDLSPWRISSEIFESGGNRDNITMKFNGVMSAEKLLYLANRLNDFGKENGITINIDFTTTGSTNLHISIDGIGNDEARLLLDQLLKTIRMDHPSVAGWQDSFHHKDYFHDKLSVDLWDGHSIILRRIRASSPVGDVIRMALEQSEMALFLCSGNTEYRLDPLATLHDAGVRPGNDLSLRLVGPILKEFDAQLLKQAELHAHSLIDEISNFFSDLPLEDTFVACLNQLNISASLIESNWSKSAKWNFLIKQIYHGASPAAGDGWLAIRNLAKIVLHKYYPNNQNIQRIAQDPVEWANQRYSGNIS